MSKARIEPEIEHVHRPAARAPLTAALCLGLAVALGSGCGGDREADRGAGTADTAEGAAPADTLSTIRVIPDVRTPESVHVGPDGRYYVSEIGEFGGDGDGRILALDPDSWEPSVLADGLNDPKGLASMGDTLFVTDRDRIVRIGPDGATSDLVTAEDFPTPPQFLNDLVAGPDGRLYVSDTGDFEAVDGAVYAVDPDGQVTAIASSGNNPDIASPNGLTFAEDGSLLVIDLMSGRLLHVGPNGATEAVADGFGGGDGLEFASDGSLYATDVQNGRVFRVTFADAGAEVTQVASVERAADLGLDSQRGLLLIPQLEQNSITVLEIP